MLSFFGAKVHPPCWIQAIEVPQNHYDVHLGRSVALDRGVILLATGDRLDKPRICIGSSTYINRHTMIDAAESIQVGANCMIGPFCYITDHDHGMKQGIPIHRQPLVSKPVHIGNDVWIGAHATILKGVEIGDGAVVGAGSVVTKSVGENSIVAGVPARLIGRRSTENQA